MASPNYALVCWDPPCLVPPVQGVVPCSGCGMRLMRLSGRSPGLWGACGLLDSITPNTYATQYPNPEAPGFYYQFNAADGGSYIIRGHGRMPSAPAGSTSSQIWTARIQRIGGLDRNRFLRSDGRWLRVSSRTELNMWGQWSTHIPLFMPV